jgi:hypothetical protein
MTQPAPRAVRINRLSGADWVDTVVCYHGGPDGYRDSGRIGMGEVMIGV